MVKDLTAGKGNCPHLDNEKYIGETFKAEIINYFLLFNLHYSDGES